MILPPEWSCLEKGRNLTPGSFYYIVILISSEGLAITTGGYIQFIICTQQQVDPNKTYSVSQHQAGADTVSDSTDHKRHTLKTAAIESAGLTDVGKLRKENEDALLVNDDLGLYVVADGMGGHRAGEIASKLVVESIQEFISEVSTDEEDESNEIRDTSLSIKANRVLAGIEHANRVVHQAALDEEACEGMGSTVSMLLFDSNTLVAANVGDSPIYLIHNRKIETLSIPHTVMAEQMAIDPEAAAELGSEYHHMLTQAMGANNTVNANICEVPYFKGDILVIGSDGLSDLVTPEETLEIAINVPPESACRQMVALANDRGGLDNITVIVVRIHATGNGSPNIKELISRFISGIFNKTTRQE